MDGALLVGAKRAMARPGANVKTSTVTLAELNAGKPLVPIHGAVRYRIVGFKALFNGNFLTGTSMVIHSFGAGSNLVYATVAQASMTDGNFVNEDAGGVTLGSAFGLELPAGHGIEVRKVGADFTGGVDVKLMVDYVISSGLEAANQLALGDDEG